MGEVDICLWLYQGNEPARLVMRVLMEDRSYQFVDCNGPKSFVLSLYAKTDIVDVEDVASN